MLDLTRVSEVQLTYKSKIKASERPKITSSRQVYDLLRPFFEEHMEYRELCYAVYLNTANRVLGVVKVSEGGCSGTVVDSKILFQGALLCAANAIILAHNHPSGSLRPSDNDISLTKKILAAGQVLSIPLLDHIILTDEGYYSFVDENKLY
jgi:DNA repair protein RadC